MSLTKNIVSHPTTIFIIFALLIGLGGFALINLPIDLLPDVSYPYIMVSTTYTGAGPEEVERSISRPLEAALSSVSNLKQINSTSSKGSSMVSMEFNYGTDLADASNSIRDALDRVRRYLPDGSDSPTIFKFDPSMMPVMGLMVVSENRSPEDLREIANDSIVPRLEQIPGVATASVTGGRDRQIRVEIQSSRLEAYGLTVTQLQQMIISQNSQVAAGSITEGGITFILNTMGEYTSLDEIRNTVIYYAPSGSDGGQPIEVYLRDIADVREGYADQQSVVYVNGQEAIQLSVQKQSGTNSVQVAKDLRKRLVNLSAELPSDIKITEIFNTTDMIESSLNNVTESAVSGAVLAVLILFLFLRSIKPTIIIGVSIPVSIVITLLVMYFWGLTLNLMTLAGLFLGVGMLVDNSIVILENIYHYREKGAKLIPAAMLGTEEMIVAITASTLTTVCVFLPLVMFQGLLEMAGELFAGLAFTVVFSLSISLFTALFLVPILSSHYMPLLTRKQAPLKGKLAVIDGYFARFLTGMENGYRRLVAKILRHKLLVVGVLFILFVGSIMLIPKIGWIFMPEQAADSVSINITMPLGTALEETEKTLKQVQGIVEKELVKDGQNAYKRIILNAGGGGRFGSGSSSNSGSLRINLLDFNEQIMTADEVQAVIRPYFNQFPGVLFRFSSGGGGMMGGSSNPVDIVLRTEDLVKGKLIADRIAELLKERIPSVTEPQVSLNDGLPQIEIELNRERMYALGLNAYTVGNEIKAAVDGITASQFKIGNDDLDIILILAEADRNSLPALDHIFVRSSITGARVPLSNFAFYREGTGPMTINRENQSRVIHVTAGIKPGVKLNDLDSQIQAMIKTEIPSEDDVIITYEGDNSEMIKMFINFLLIMVVAVALVFGVMASLFESFRDPFIILFTIPLSIIGVVAIYGITGERFNILTAVGLLVLIGVIVNNGIVLVDYTNLLRKRGYGLEEACIEAAGNRLRPILMSTLTTVLGLAPLAFAPGEGSEMVAPIGKTVFGGLTFGTLMTLFLMPAIYAKLNKHDDERRAIADMEREGIASGLTKADLKRLVQEKKAEQHRNEMKMAEAEKRK
ncbi:MAG: efflux RND transporter permease subunit [Spirochaetaceae bacterium]|jgi:HAE1 family hydrophobic/amphiphilic exporter-1|nr:efflux RND transporter permease subunit [Spirochaetaceae bacterium]